MNHCTGSGPGGRYTTVVCPLKSSTPSVVKHCTTVNQCSMKSLSACRQRALTEFLRARVETLPMALANQGSGLFALGHRKEKRSGEGGSDEADGADDGRQDAIKHVDATREGFCELNVLLVSIPCAFNILEKNGRQWLPSQNFTHALRRWLIKMEKKRGSLS